MHILQAELAIGRGTVAKRLAQTTLGHACGSVTHTHARARTHTHVHTHTHTHTHTHAHIHTHTQHAYAHVTLVTVSPPDLPEHDAESPALCAAWHRLSVSSIDHQAARTAQQSISKHARVNTTTPLTGKDFGIFRIGLDGKPAQRELQPLLQHKGVCVGIHALRLSFP
jgi:hypothetical protein